MPNFNNFSVHVTCCRGSVLDDKAMRYLLPVFLDDIMFSYNGGNRQESEDTEDCKVCHLYSYTEYISSYHFESKSASLAHQRLRRLSAWVGGV